MIRTIPLNKLVPSSRNVRRRTDEAADLQLKADIEARGLLQNLVVTRAARSRGSFAVEAGGRRLRALNALVEDGKLAAAHEVCCLVVEAGAAAQEASLAENFQRLSMNPADECTAFQQLIDQGADIDGIASRFGLTSRFVEGRLRLASLAPVVFDALGAGEISLDVAKAYAASSDQERQAYVFEQMSRGYGAAYPDSIRRMMTQLTVSATDRRARYVGEEAYVAAGGRIERDLFADDAATRWLDVALLERLAAEKLEKAAVEAATETGLSWVRPTLESWVGHGQTEGLRRIPVQPAALTEEEAAQIDCLETEMEELAAILEDERVDAADREEAEDRMRALSGTIDAIASKPPVIDAELKAQAGAFLLLDGQGRPRLDPSLYCEEVDGEGRSGSDGQPPLPDGGEPPARAAGLSQRLVDELAMQRRDILAVHVAANPDLALDLAIFLMVDREAGSCREKSGSSLIAAPPANPLFDFRTPDSAATIARAEAAGALDRSWTEPGTKAGRFDAFRALSDEVRAAWLGHAVAGTLDASLNLPGERNCGFHDHLGRLLGIDVARWWRPTGSNFFDRVPKSVTLTALGEVGGPAFAERYAKAKKVELAQSCERIFSGDFIGDVEVKQAALAWVPGPMLFASPEPLPADADPHAAQRPSDLDADVREGHRSPGCVLDAIEDAA